MLSPSTAQLVDAWDRALSRSALGRTETLLALASPETDVVALDALTLGDRERRLLSVRAAAFGPKLTGLVACEACGESLELQLPVDDLLGLHGPTTETLALEHEGYALRLRLPDGADLRAVAEGPAETAAARLLASCVTEAKRGGVSVPSDELPPGVVEAAGEALAQADPLADLRIGLTCVACGHAWQSPFDTASFLWTELDAWAGRILREVHALAGAYGWTERDILSLSPGRRAQYLEMVTG
jgi:hypothetical protein